MDRLEPDKGRQAKLLTEHLTRQRVLPSIEEELLHQLEQKAKREVERQQAAEEKAKHREVAEHQATNSQEVIQADIVATFGRMVREVALTAGATMEQALEAERKAATDAKASMTDASTMRK